MTLFEIREVRRRRVRRRRGVRRCSEEGMIVRKRVRGREDKRDKIRGLEYTVDKRWKEGDQVKMFIHAYLHSYAHIYIHFYTHVYKCHVKYI